MSDVMQGANDLPQESLRLEAWMRGKLALLFAGRR